MVGKAEVLLITLAMAVLYVKVPISSGSVTVSRHALLTFFTADILTRHLRKITSETNVVNNGSVLSNVQENHDRKQNFTIPTVFLLLTMRPKH